MLVAAASLGASPGLASAARASVRRSAAAQPLNVVWTNVALPLNIDPALGFDSDTLMVVRNVYEGLLDYVPGSTTVRPGLAESWHLSPDGLTYTFNLRKGVVFHDGAKLDAAAAVKNLYRIREINQGPASLLVNIKSFQAKGPSQVVVHMSAPYAFLPGVMPWLPIVSRRCSRCTPRPPIPTRRSGSRATLPEPGRTCSRASTRTRGSTSFRTRTTGSRGSTARRRAVLLRSMRT